MNRDDKFAIAAGVCAIAIILAAVIWASNKADDCEKRGGTLIQMKCLDIKELK